MKQWIFSLSFITVCVLVFGLICKANFKDCGISNIKTYKDIYSLNCGINYIFGCTKDDEIESYDSFLKYENNYVKSLDKAPIVVIGKPTGNLANNLLSFCQEITIESIIKGDDLQQGKKYFIYNVDGFILNPNNQPIYDGIQNIMNKTSSYLIFLEPSELNKYTKDTYRLYGSYFSYLNISNGKSYPIKTPLEDLKFNDLKDIEFFASSQRILDQIYKIKQRILDKYI
jgi:hypothetical protein